MYLQIKKFICKEVKNGESNNLYRWSVFNGYSVIGGWAAVLMFETTYRKILYREKNTANIINETEYREISGREKNTTNNVMELTAIIKGLQALKEPCEVDLYSDSAYIVNAFNENWLHNWKKNCWRNSSRKPVKNQNLWIELDRLTKVHKVNFYKVKGHSGNIFNNICDELAVAERQKLENKIEEK